MNGPALLDTEVLDDLIAHIGLDAVRAIIEIFLGECRELAAAMRGPTSPGEARRAAHSLKSSAGQIGAVALAEAALAVEAAASSNPAELPARVAVLAQVAAATEPILAARLSG